ncbi:MAG: tripartite tricarboxylate transporter substrate binding protein, partial [Betaproteobacteria bacterium]|nr:tripartite tricarboxylate transporter substrate binding protein [Betaproteobacteria bacterium]
DVPASNLQELIRYAKANPGKLDYATWGVGTSGHLIMEWLKRQYGLDLRHVPYKSMAQIYQEMMGGLVKIAFVDSASSVSHVRAGKIRALGTTGPSRAAVMPDVPTFMEQDVKFGIDGWYGFFVAKGTPEAIVNRLNQETLRVLADKSMEQRLRSVNIVNTPAKSPDEFTRTVANDLKVWQTIVRENNIKPD